MVQVPIEHSQTFIFRVLYIFINQILSTWFKFYADIIIMLMLHISVLLLS
mgnify:CR=1 FL=1